MPRPDPYVDANVDANPPPPPPIELALEAHGPPILDPDEPCAFCTAEHPVGVPTGACPIRLVTVDDLTQRRRRARNRLS